MDDLFRLLRSKQKELNIYSPYSFLHHTNKDTLTENTVIQPLIDGIKKDLFKVINIKKENKNHYFIEKYLKWDSEYFQIPTYKIELIIYYHDSATLLNEAINSYIEQIPENSYYFISIPTEDLILLQALGHTKFKLILTNLNFYLPNLNNHNEKRFAVRNASMDDISSLKSVASNMRNIFDRVHADPAFTNKVADEYLAKFLEESIKGFADFVLVPNLPHQEPFGFLAANKPLLVMGYNISKFVLAAVNSSVEKGWLYKLVSEMIYLLKEYNVDILTTTTQSANRAAIRVWEKSGFRLGYVTHIYSIKK
jgi:dTDP-4-amino-4,6-dideoxy-D-galactose acyltransferase